MRSLIVFLFIKFVWAQNSNEEGKKYTGRNAGFLQCHRHTAFSYSMPSAYGIPSALGKVFFSLHKAKSAKNLQVKFFL